jgi:hypothetical protein
VLLTCVVACALLAAPALPPDFIGLSAYASLPTNLTMPSMEVSIQTVAYEFQSFGISLRNLLLRSNKRLIFSEQGLGGYRDGRISPDVPTLAKYPFLGGCLPPLPGARSAKRSSVAVVSVVRASGNGTCVVFCVMSTQHGCV